MSFDQSLSTFRLRERCWELWSGVLNTSLSSDEVPSIDRVPLLVPAPILADHVKLTMPFVLADIKHPKIPTAMGPRKAWTDSQRSAIRANRPLTVRWKSDFDRHVSSFSTFLPFDARGPFHLTLLSSLIFVRLLDKASFPLRRRRERQCEKRRRYGEATFHPLVQALHRQVSPIYLLSFVAFGLNTVAVKPLF